MIAQSPLFIEQWSRLRRKKRGIGWKSSLFSRYLRWSYVTRYRSFNEHKGCNAVWWCRPREVGRDKSDKKQRDLPIVAYNIRNLVALYGVRIKELPGRFSASRAASCSGITPFVLHVRIVKANLYHLLFAFSFYKNLL